MGRSGSFALLATPFTALFGDPLGDPPAEPLADSFAAGFTLAFDPVFALDAPALTAFFGAFLAIFATCAPDARFDLAAAGAFAAFAFFAGNAAFFGAAALDFFAERFTLLVKLRVLVRLESGSLMVSLQESGSSISPSVLPAVTDTDTPMLC